MGTFSPPTTQEEQIASLLILPNTAIGRFDKIEVLHTNCHFCRKEAERAATTASMTGSTGATHGTTEVWSPGEPVSKPYAHVARVTDTTAEASRLAWEAALKNPTRIPAAVAPERSKAEVTLAVFDDLHPSSAKLLWIAVARDLAEALRATRGGN